MYGRLTGFGLIVLSFWGLYSGFFGEWNDNSAPLIVFSILVLLLGIGLQSPSSAQKAEVSLDVKAATNMQDAGGKRADNEDYDSIIAPKEEYILSQFEAKVIFQEYKQHKKLCWEIPNTGCEARADLMAEIAQKKGYSPRKIWMYPNSDSILSAHINQSCTETVIWDFHVAPLLAVEIDGANRELVFDPTLFDGPQEIPDWTARYSSGSNDMYLNFSEPRSYFTDSDHYYVDEIRDKALKTRGKTLKSQFDLSDPIIFKGRMQFLRGKMLDELKLINAISYRALKNVLSSDDYVSHFDSFFYSPMMNKTFSELLNNNQYFYAIPCEEILSALDFDDPFVYLQFIKKYWPRVKIIFINLQKEADKLWHGLDYESQNFKRLWNNETEKDEDFICLWFNPLSEDLWLEWGIDIDNLSIHKNQ
jgi:hypothetical protein